jgi:hypothetical protein
MKTMSDHNYNTGLKTLDFGLLAISWIGSILAINITIIPIVLSSIASLMAIVNYYYQIKKNKKHE